MPSREPGSQGCWRLGLPSCPKPGVLSTPRIPLPHLPLPPELEKVLVQAPVLANEQRDGLRNECTPSSRWPRQSVTEAQSSLGWGGEAGAPRGVETHPPLTLGCHPVSGCRDLCARCWESGPGRSVPCEVGVQFSFLMPFVWYFITAEENKRWTLPTVDSVSLLLISPTLSSQGSGDMAPSSL